jgi:hypothetical protein
LLGGAAASATTATRLRGTRRCGRAAAAARGDDDPEHRDGAELPEMLHHVLLDGSPVGMRRSPAPDVMRIDRARNARVTFR